MQTCLERLQHPVPGAEIAPLAPAMDAIVESLEEAAHGPVIAVAAHEAWQHHHGMAVAPGGAPGQRPAGEIERQDLHHGAVGLGERQQSARRRHKGFQCKPFPLGSLPTHRKNSVSHKAPCIIRSLISKNN